VFVRAAWTLPTCLRLDILALRHHTNPSGILAPPEKKNRRPEISPQTNSQTPPPRLSSHLGRQIPSCLSPGLACWASGHPARPERPHSVVDLLTQSLTTSHTDGHRNRSFAAADDPVLLSYRRRSYELILPTDTSGITLGLDTPLSCAKPPVSRRRAALLIDHGVSLQVQEESGSRAV
jgi:hypothetical protein